MNRRAAKPGAADARHIETMGPAEKAGGEKSLVRLSLLRSLSSPPTKVEERMPTEKAEPISPTAERDYRVSPPPVKRSFPPATAKKIRNARPRLPPGPAEAPPCLKRPDSPKRRRTGLRPTQEETAAVAIACPPADRTNDPAMPGRPMAHLAPKTPFSNAPDRTRTCDLRFRKPSRRSSQRAKTAFSVAPERLNRCKSGIRTCGARKDIRSRRCSPGALSTFASVPTNYQREASVAWLVSGRAAPQRLGRIDRLHRAGTRTGRD